MGTVAKDRDPVTYLTASGLAALINFPLWKAAAIGQSGFASQGTSLLASARILFGPPYKGVAATLFGMTWARAAIFYGCDVGKDALLSSGHSMAVASWLPSIVISTFVQVANQPIVRGTVTIQNPASTHANLGAALADIYRQRGVSGLWHGTGLGPVSKPRPVWRPEQPKRLTGRGWPELGAACGLAWR